MSAIIRLDMAREAIANEIYNTIMCHKDSSHYVLTNSIMSLLDKYSISAAEVGNIKELPCKIGDTLYEFVEKKRHGKWQPVIVERNIDGFYFDNVILYAQCDGHTVYLNNLGSSVFLDRSEAETKVTGRIIR